MTHLDIIHNVQKIKRAWRRGLLTDDQFRYMMAVQRARLSKLG